jgi:hypothetical protein
MKIDIRVSNVSTKDRVDENVLSDYIVLLKNYVNTKEIDDMH